MSAGNTAEVLECIGKARRRCKMQAGATVHRCYEAGRAGGWLHRWLRTQGVDTLVVASARIEVNRRARRAKTDRLDGAKLLALRLRYHGGARRVGSVGHAPTAPEEEARRTHRERQRLMRERMAHTHRISALRVRHNLRPHLILGGRDWARWWSQHGEQVLARLRAEIERESARRALVKEHVTALEAMRQQELVEGRHPVVAQLARLRAIGPRGAWILDQELFGWRRCANRRELAGCLALVPTPYASGISQLEQGISQAGNKRARALLVERAWQWLSLQPHSALTQWFKRRFATGGQRLRRVGIVAVARRLAIALWRYLENGARPPGAERKPLAA